LIESIPPGGVGEGNASGVGVFKAVKSLVDVGGRAVGRSFDIVGVGSRGRVAGADAEGEMLSGKGEAGTIAGEIPQLTKLK
jgi:hypothetical protein